MIVTGGQSLFDIAVQEYGSVAGVFLLLMDNPQLSSIYSNALAGYELKVQDAPVGYDMRVIKYFRTNGIRVATGRVKIGIGDMIIEDTFIVQ